MELNVSTKMFSDPAMRPHLKKLYTKQYAALQESINSRAKELPQTAKIKLDGKVVEGKGFSAEQMLSMVPDFDKWPDIKARFSEDVQSRFTGSTLNNAEQRLQYWQQHHPDTSSGVRAVFSDGNKISGYINEQGGVVSHSGGHDLQDVQQKAEKLNLTGEAKIAYMVTNGRAILARNNPDLKMTEYTSGDTPTRREFMEQWYPKVDIDKSYQAEISDAMAELESRKKMHLSAEQRLNEMRMFLLESIANG
ncbi:MAG: hypothetical protein ACRBBN_09960 [Methyloligellaceae bacterium]